MIRVHDTRQAASERVAKGAALLDEIKPDWRNGIDLERFNIHSSQLCILGQLFGSYIDGLYALWGSMPLTGNDRPAEAHGFMVSGFEAAWADEALADAWRAEING